MDFTEGIWNQIVIKEFNEKREMRRKVRQQIKVFRLYKNKRSS